jgi:sugar lactone lactonase YvrE
VAWDADGDIFVADGIGNARIAKFTRDGVFVKSWGSRGTGDSQFKTAHAIAVDAAGNIYVGDRGNNRIQVFDNNGNFKSSITSGGDPEALCITPGAHQYLYSSNSNPANDLDHGGEITKLELSGTVVGKFGQAGKGPRDFGSVNAIDCRSANSLYVAEAGNWRVTKVDLH